MSCFWILTVHFLCLQTITVNKGQILVICWARLTPFQVQLLTTKYSSKFPFHLTFSIYFFHALSYIFCRYECWLFAYCIQVIGLTQKVNVDQFIFTWSRRCDFAIFFIKDGNFLLCICVNKPKLVVYKRSFSCSEFDSPLLRGVGCNNVAMLWHNVVF